MIWRFLLLMWGVFACATAVIMIKLTDEHPVLLASLRCLVAAVVLGPLFFRDLRRNRGIYTRRHLTRAVLPGALLGVHFVSWIVGARMTPAANSSLIVNMVPLAMPVFLYALIRERLGRGEIAGTALAIAGMAVLAAADFRIEREHFTGDVICFVSMLFFCLYLVLGRKNRDFPSIWLYLVPLYLVAGVLCFAASLFCVNPVKSYALRDVLIVLSLAIVPTVMGHSILNYSMKRMSGQVVGIANLGQVVFAGVMAFFILGESPAPTFYAAAVLIVCGIAVAFQSAASPRTEGAHEMPGHTEAPTRASQGGGGT